MTVCDNMMFKGDFTPVLHKHTSRLDLIELLSVGVDKMQRNFDPLKQQIEDWKTEGKCCTFAHQSAMSASRAR